MFPLVEVLRPANCLMAAAAVPLGAAVSTGAGPGPAAIPAAAAVFLVCGAGNVVNDYFDRDIDRINAPHRPIPSGRLGPSAAIAYAAALFLAGVASAAAVSPAATAIAAAASLLLVAYARWGKRMGLGGNVAVSLLVGLVPVYGGVAALPAGDLRRVAVLGVCAFLANLGRELVKAIEDLEGDVAGDALSVPAVHGPERARSLATASLALAAVLGLVPFAVGAFTSRAFLAAILAADALFALAVAQLYRGPLARESAGRSQRTIKAGMLCALAAFLVGDR